MTQPHTGQHHHWTPNTKQLLTIQGIRSVMGPNVYHHKPVLIMKLHLGELTEKESLEIPGFNDRLLTLLPGLEQHHCARGRLGGFVERLHEGTYFGHVTEHVALELASMLGSPVTHGKTRYAGEAGLYNVIVRYTSEQAMQYLLRVAVDLVNTLVMGDMFVLEPHLAEAGRIKRGTDLGPSTRAIVEAAERRSIPWRRLNDESLLQLGSGKHRKFVQAALSSHTSHIAVDIASDKELTKRMLRDAFLPVPRGKVVRTREEAVAALVELGGRAVVKPLDGNQGKGVSLDLTTPAQVTEAFDVAKRYSDRVLVEELFEGTDYRVLVVGGKVVAASERLPCHVTGDGTHTIAELIERANRDPQRGEGHEKPLTTIEVDEVVRAHLAKHRRDLTQVPQAGERVFLRQAANLSKGGTARDVTDELHPDVRSMCERAALTVGLDICGVDLVTNSIAKPLQQGGIVELNAAPGLRMHQHPTEGTPRDAGAAIVDMLYPPSSPTRVPVLSVTGTNGKTTVTRLIAHVMRATGRTVGMTTTDGIIIGTEQVVTGDTTGPASARMVLAHPAVEVAVLETARGGMLRDGLGYDWSDVSVMTNIRLDHIGQDGIEDLDDLVWIKSLVAERVREGGTLVLNADDAELVRLADEPRLHRVRKEIIYTTTDSLNPTVTQHLMTGGTAYTLEHGWIVERRRDERRAVVHVTSIPITLGGTALYQVQNCMAAVAACHAQGVAFDDIAAALASFDSARHNPGRANLYRVGDGYLMLDYGHNPDAFEAAGNMLRHWSGPVTAIIGVPGDRDDSVIREAAQVAARHFSRLVIKEDSDLRGRQPGEVAALFCATAKAAVPNLDCQVILDDVQALQHELPRIEAGALAIMFFDRLEPLLDIIKARGAVPVADLRAKINVMPEGQWPTWEEVN